MQRHLRETRDLLDAHYAEDIDLGAVAAIAGVSKYHFLGSRRSIAVVDGQPARVSSSCPVIDRPLGWLPAPARHESVVSRAR